MDLFDQFEEEEHATQCLDHGNLTGALSCYIRLISRYPKEPKYLNRLAYIFSKLGNFDQAEKVLKKAIALEPSNYVFYANLAAFQYINNKATASFSNYEKALELNKKDTKVINNFACQLMSVGCVEEALPYFRSSFKIDKNRNAFSIQLLSMNYLEQFSQRDIFVKSQRTQQLFCRKRKRRRVQIKNQVLPRLISSHTPKRKIRIGYISANFCFHSIHYFLYHILENHNREIFDITLYSTGKKKDVFTELLKKKYRFIPFSVEKLGIQRVINEIQKDNLDIIIELDGHTQDNNLILFKSPLAKRQVSYLGYPNTTGLETIHYRLIDAVTDREYADVYYTESLLRLSGCFLCFSPEMYTFQNASPKVINEPPFVKNGAITFGSFNFYGKIRETNVRLWSQLLLRIPHSKLVLKSIRINNDYVKKKMYERFSIYLTEEQFYEKIVLLDYASTVQEHLECYNQIDISLDTYPYNGTTTTFESLYMNVPVVTLCGNRHATRVSTSILQHMNESILEPFIIYEEQEYVDKVITITKNRELLLSLRKNLRKMLLASDLCDDKKFIKKYEKVLCNL